MPQMSDIELLEAELAYDEVSMQGPNRNLEQQAKELYLDKLKWVDEYVSPFVVVTRRWKGHKGGYKFTMEESARRRLQGDDFITRSHCTVRAMCNNYITPILHCVYNKDGSPLSGLNRQEAIARVKDNIPFFHAAKRGPDVVHKSSSLDQTPQRLLHLSKPVSILHLPIWSGQVAWSIDSRWL